MKSFKKSYPLRVDEELFEKLKLIASNNRRSLNAQIESLIEDHILEYEKENGKIIIPDSE